MEGVILPKMYHLHTKKMVKQYFFSIHKPMTGKERIKLNLSENVSRSNIGYVLSNFKAINMSMSMIQKFIC